MKIFTSEVGVGIVVKIYDLTKVDQSVIAIDEETFIGNIDVRFSLTIPFLNRKVGLSVGIESIGGDWYEK
jgi:hypothetical protein